MRFILLIQVQVETFPDHVPIKTVFELKFFLQVLTATSQLIPIVPYPGKLHYNSANNAVVITKKEANVYINMEQIILRLRNKLNSLIRLQTHLNRNRNL